MSGNFKQVIVVRTDIKLSKGKLAVQVAHASVAASLIAKDLAPSWFDSWLREGQKKIAVKVPSLDKLLEVRKEAESLGIPLALITDSGLTEVPPGTTTCLGLGPAPADIMDKVTGKLKLL